MDVGETVLQVTFGKPDQLGFNPGRGVKGLDGVIGFDSPPLVCQPAGGGDVAAAVIPDWHVQGDGFVFGIDLSVKGFQMEGLHIKRFGNTYEEQLDWALFIAYNRNPQWYADRKKLCEKYESYHSGYDAVVGLIAMIRCSSYWKDSMTGHFATGH